jgi:anti-sigma regulatory factor (Ser/Thr protein kinase)
VERRWPLEPPTEPVSEHDLGPSLGELRRAVADDPMVASLSDGRRDDLVLAVNEAATNAVRHGDGGCTARIWHDGRGVVAEVSSQSSLHDPLAGRRERPEPEARSGRGLWLINAICDLVELRSGDRGVTLRMHMSDAA